jgi:hypothetical protein
MNKGILLFLIFGFVFIVGAPPVEREYVLMEMKFDNGQFVLKDKSLEKGNSPSINHIIDRKYVYNLKSKKEQILYEDSLDPSLLFSDNGEEELSGGIIEVDNIDFFLLVPSIVEGDKVEILKDGQKVFEERVFDVGAENCRVR